MNTATIEKMKSMRLKGMHDAFESLLETNQQLDYSEALSLLIDAEWEYRHENKMRRYIKQAAFRYQASIEEIDFAAKRNIDKAFVRKLTDCSFIDRSENILITGPTGVGKSFIASAIGHQACVREKRVAYFNIQKLFNLLKMSAADQSYLRLIRKIERTDLLILDDFGLQPFDHQSRMSLLEIIDDRNNRKSTIIAAQLPVKKWSEIINEKTIADAILDRLVHGAHRLELKGESMRKTLKSKIN